MVINIINYRPVLLDLKKLEGDLMLNEQANLFLGGTTFCQISEIRFPRLRTPVKVLEGTNQDIVKLVANGIEMTLQTDKDLVKPYMPNIDRPVLRPSFETPPGWYYRIDKDVPVYWDDGRLAGKVRQFFGYQFEVAPEDSRWCEVMREFLLNERLCFKTNDIEVREVAAGN